MPALPPRDGGLVHSLLLARVATQPQPPSDADAAAVASTIITSPTIPDSATAAAAVLFARASSGFVAIPSTYSAQSSSPAPGVVAGIVLGSVGGFMLLIALLYSCTGWRPVFLPWRSSSATARVATVEERTVFVEEERRRTGSHKRKSKRHSHRHRPRRRGSYDEEMFEVRTAATTTRRPSVSGRAVPVPVHHIPAVPPAMMPGVRVSQTTTTTRGGPPPRVMRDDVTTSDTTEEEVVVIEERSPPRHKSSQRSPGGRRSYDSRRGSQRYS